MYKMELLLIVIGIIVDIVVIGVIAYGSNLLNKFLKSIILILIILFIYLHYLQ